MGNGKLRSKDAKSFLDKHFAKRKIKAAKLETMATCRHTPAPAGKKCG